jgi:aspartate racemase
VPTFLLLAANTAHVFADAVAAARSIPLLHIADVTAARLADRGLRRVGVLGTEPTMEGSFLVGRLRERHGVDVALPHADRRAQMDALIRDELTVGVVSRAGAEIVASAVAELIADGAEAIVLACTELTLVDVDADVLCFDTTAIHAEAAVELALAPSRS